ncbi:MAG: hypothetical protein RLZZ387_2543 [Chloroflexota bacterium]|jgi:hypothetical protein
MKSLALLFGVAVSVMSLITLSPTLPANDVTSWVIPAMSLALITQQMMRLGAGIDRLELLTAAPEPLAGTAGGLSPDWHVPPRADASPMSGVLHLLDALHFVALPQHLGQRGSGNAPPRPCTMPAPHPQLEPPVPYDGAAAVRALTPLPDVRNAAALVATPGASLPPPETCGTDVVPQPASTIPSPETLPIPTAASGRGRPADPIYDVGVDRLLAGEPIKQVAEEISRARDCHLRSAVRHLRARKRERLIALGLLEP